MEDSKATPISMKSGSSNLVILAQPNDEENKSNKIKPPLFCISLIIGDEVVHNFMIEFGASTSIMPRNIIDQLGIKYEPMTKGVNQLDGTSCKIIGVVKYLNLALHTCLGCTILQDISIIDLPTHSTICLSRDFTTKMGGYITVDWSFMVFRTGYVTHASIKVEPLFMNHVELYMISLEDMRCNLFDEEEKYLDLFRYMDEARPRIYVIHEQDVVIPNLIQGVKEK